MASNSPYEGRPTSDAEGERSRLPIRTAGASHPPHTEARAELRDRETYYAELRHAVHRRSRTAEAVPDIAAPADQTARDDNWTRDEMATPAADTWT
ncbi:MAG: hypothetical protein ACRDPY_10225 [Streptosporangiaceae bacterium]